MSGEPIPGDDGRLRCPWALSAPDYVTYHDEEWGVPLRTDDAMFERMSLEAFQSGLSWLIILRKRQNFRRAFAGFAIEAVAEFGPADVERLLTDAGIVRNRAKIEATISNARAAAEIPDGLLDLVLAFGPETAGPPPRTLSDVRSRSEESVALAKAAKQRGLRFVGPTTAYALMQATGIVNDHLAGCYRR